MATLRYKTTAEHKAETAILQAQIEAKERVPLGSGNACETGQNLPAQVSEEAWRLHNELCDSAGVKPFQES